MGCAICSDNINNNARKISNIERRKKVINHRYNILNSKINEVNNYLNETQLFIKTINNEIFEYNELEKKYLDNENLKKKIEIKVQIRIEMRNHFSDIELLLDKLKNNKKIKLEFTFKKINEYLTEIDTSFKNNIQIETDFENYIENISKELINFEQLKKELMEMNFSEIKTKIQEIQIIINNKLIEYNEIQNEINKLIENIKIVSKLEDNNIDNSTPIDSKEKNNIDNISPTPIFIKTDVEKFKLLVNNWHEKCTIYDEYDLYERNFEYSSIELPKRISLSLKQIPFTKHKIIKIIEFKIDNKIVDYKYENSKLKFKKIKFKGLQTKKVYIKYKQSNILTENQKKQRKIYREDFYGISKNLKGRFAKFYLIIKNDMEIISFDDEIFTKIKEDEYKIDSFIPNEGKMTRVILSKKSAKFNFCFTKKIETINKNSYINNTKLILHYYFEDGGNMKNNIKIIKETNPPKGIINVNNIERQYIIEFNNIKQNYAELIIKGELTNHSTGEYKCNLTEEQIEKEIPEEYKTNKDYFKKISNNIINDYDIKHKNDSIKITDLAKIGKWIKKNIIYDEKEKSISALEIYKKKKGVCKQYTILFNALLYALGYKCIYVSGFVIKDNVSFNLTNAHSWSLVRINDKWLPFDATWGIFSGNLPVSHIFQNYFQKTNFTITKDKLINNDDIYGKFIE